MLLNVQLKAIEMVKKAEDKTREFIKNEQGDFVGSLGMWAIIVTVLVSMHGLITGWLPGFVQGLFSRLDTL